MLQYTVDVVATDAPPPRNSLSLFHSNNARPEKQKNYPSQNNIDILVQQKNDLVPPPTETASFLPVNSDLNSQNNVVSLNDGLRVVRSDGPRTINPLR